MTQRQHARALAAIDPLGSFGDADKRVRMAAMAPYMNGVGEGIKTSLKMKDVGLGMLMAKRLSPMELIGGHKCKGAGDLKKILKKAEELEAARIPVAGK